MGGVSGHHGGHLVISGTWLPKDLLASDTGSPRASHLCAVTRAAGLAHVLVPGGAGGLRHAAAALRGWRLEARAVGGSARRQVVVDRATGLPQGDDLAPGVMLVPVQHVGVRGVEHWGLLLTTLGWRLVLTTLKLDSVLLTRRERGPMRGGRGPGGHSDDGGAGRDGGRHQHLARAAHRIKVWEWT